MKITLSCTECDYEVESTSDRTLMNKIITWNHIKNDHPDTAAYIMRVYQHVPSSLFHMHAAVPAH